MEPFLPSPYQSALIKDRVIKVIGGDDVSFLVLAKLNGVPATPLNACIRACLADTQVSSQPLWEGAWYCGLEPAGGGIDGLVRVKIPREVLLLLRQGAYAIAVSVSDKLQTTTQTVAEGSLQLQYSATSPQHVLPDALVPETALALMTMVDASRLSVRTIDVPTGSTSFRIVVGYGYAIVASPVLVPPSNNQSVWLTNVSRVENDVMVYFNAPTAGTGWKLSYVVLEV